MAAFARAVAAGYRYLETDVHATADGVLVVFHDDDLRRMFGRPGRVEDLRWADLASLREGGQTLLPRLSDVLEEWPEHRFNIDMKADSAVQPTVEVVAHHAARDRVLLASFNDRRVRRARALCGPRQATSLGQRETAALRLASVPGVGRFGFVPRAAAAQVPVRYRGVRVVDRRFVRHAHRLGLQVHVWTIDEPAEMHYLLDLGVDGIMTDHIAALREVLTARGQWAA
jgi:glycerophosphoryl diester phosphodiesterase